MTEIHPPSELGKNAASVGTGKCKLICSLIQVVRYLIQLLANFHVLGTPTCPERGSPANGKERENDECTEDDSHLLSHTGIDQEFIGFSTRIALHFSRSLRYC